MMMINISDRTKILAEHQAESCRVMGNAQRVLILWLLLQNKRTANELAQALGASLATIHHHLRILTFHDLVEMNEENRNYFYTIKDTEFTRNCPALGNRPDECDNLKQLL